MFDELNPDPNTVVQSVDVMRSSEHAFSVQLSNGNSTNLKLLDMPLLIDIDLSSSKDNEIFGNGNVASDDDFNNNPHVSLHLPTTFIVTNSQPLQLNDSCQFNTSDEPLVDIHATDIFPDDDISEFLIFHKKRPTDSDPKLNSRCYVKLKRLPDSAIVETEKRDTSDVETRLQKRRTSSANEVNSRVSRSNSKKLESSDDDCQLINKQSKHTETGRTALNKQPNVASVRVLKRNAKNPTNAPSVKKMKHNLTRTENSSTLHANCNNSWNNEDKLKDSDNGCAVHPINGTLKHTGTGRIADIRPKLILKIVRDKFSNSYRCYSIYRIPERFSIRNCSVSIQRLPKLQPTAARNRRRLSSSKKETISMTRKSVTAHSLSDDIEALVLPSSTKNLRMTKLRTVTEADKGKVTDTASNSASLSTDRNGCRTKALESEFRNAPTELSDRKRETAHSLCNDIEPLISPTKNLRITNLETVTDADPLENETGNIPTGVCENSVTSAAEIVHNFVGDDDDGDDDDDNSSICSGISLHPSMSGIDDWPDEDTNRVSPTEGWNLASYRIPRVVSTAAQEAQSQEIAMDEEIEEMLAEALRSSPEMISPIKDLPETTTRQQLKPSENRSSQQTNRQPSVTTSNGMTEFDDAPNHPKTKQTCQTNQPDHTNGSNEQLENIAGMTTKIDKSGPLAQGTAFKSKIDFKNVEKLTINVGDLSSKRIVSLANTNPITHAPLEPQVTTVNEHRVQSTVNVSTLNSTRTALLTNANPTGMVTHSQPALPAAQVQCSKGIHIVPVQSTLNVGGLISTRIASLSSANTTGIVTQPIDSAQDDKKRKYFSATMRLFEQPCINFFDNRPCREGISCHFNHQLPDADKVLDSMRIFPNDQIHFIYTSFILKTIMAFSQYFPMICYLFGIRKMKEALVSSVDRCNAFKRYDFYRFIFGGLLMCGMPNWEALQIFDDFADICEESVAALIEIGKNPSNPFLS